MAHTRRRQQRDTNDPYSESLAEVDRLLLEPVSPLPTVDPLEGVRSVSLTDTRRWSPDPLPLDVAGLAAQVGMRGEFNQADNVSRMMELGQTPRQSREVYSARAFRNPRYVEECIRRKQRREVIMADPRKRRGGAGAKRRRRDEYSDIHC